MLDPATRARWTRRLAIATAAVAVYALAGFLLAPRLLRRALERDAAAALERKVSVADVSVNPFTLSAVVRGLAVLDRDGEPFVAWEELRVRLAPWRIALGEVGVASVRLRRPLVRVALGKDGRVNFQDLLERPEAPGKRRLGIYLGLLDIEEAGIRLVDGTRQPAFEKSLGPVSFRLQRFRTRPDSSSPYSFAGSTESGERFSWEGEIRTDPLRSTGKLAIERLRLGGYRPYTREQAPAEVRDGLATLAARYELAWGAGQRMARIADGRFEISGLRVGRAGVPEDDLALPALEVSGIRLDAVARSAEVARAALRGGRVRVLRGADGLLNLAALVEKPLAQAEGGPRAEPARAPFAWAVSEVAVEGLRVEWEDRVPRRPVSLFLDPVALRLEKLSSEAASAWPFSLTLGWNGRGTLSATGAVAPLELRGEASVEAQGLDLAPVSPYAEAPAGVLAEGRLTARARGRWDLRPGRGRGEAGAVSGELRLEGVRMDEPGGEELLRLRALEVAGIDVSLEPVVARVRAVRLQEPRLRVVRGGEAAPAGSAPAKPAPEAPARPGPAPRVAIDLFQIQKGRAGIVDRDMSPPAAVEVTDVEAKITGLSTDTRVRSVVEARMKVFGGEPLTVRGTLNPLQVGSYSDLEVRSRAVDLTPLAPFSGRHLGYLLAKGKLDLALDLKVEERVLRGQNVARIDQLTLGPKTDSPDAVAIPVPLALALLRDRDGVILIDVPLEGNLDDPEFRLGRVIWRAVLNLLVKVATSPFSALAALAGGGPEDLSLVELAPGEAAPGEDGAKRLALLAKALTERPALSLEIEPSVDPRADRAALQKREWDERRARAPPGDKPPSKEEEAKLVAAIALPPEALPGLASERASLARQALEAAGIDPGRLFLVQGGERAAREGGSRVYFTLR